MDRRRANAAVALVALVAASCTGSGPRAGHASRSSTRSSTTPAMVLNVRAAGHGVPAPIERAVAVDISGTVYIAGGLDPSGTTASGVFRLDSVAGGSRKLATSRKRFTTPRPRASAGSSACSVVARRWEPISCRPSIPPRVALPSRGTCRWRCPTWLRPRWGTPPIW
jgi:hypothetical protein